MPTTLAPSPTTRTTITLAGESVHLLPHRAAAWNSTLLVADLHLGKSESMQVAGISAPGAILDETLARLTAAARDAAVTRILVLGDLLHAPVGITPHMVERVAAWRAEFPVDLGIVPGNHDRRLNTLTDAWHFDIAPERLDEGPFTFTHDPRPVTGRYVVGGHLHPCVRVPNGRFPLKLACFHLRRNVAVLPAFTSFAAGVPVRREPGDRLFAIADHSVVEV